MPKVFVYGTLLSGERNNYLLADSERRGKEVVSGFSLVDLGSFPACVEDSESEISIIGEVWEISDKTLRQLDYLEGYPGFYNRKLVPTFDGDAWIYFCNNAKDGRKISSGNWKQYISERNSG